LAGIRALADYRKANRTASDVAALFSAGREDSPALVAHLIEENKKLARRVRELEEVASGVEAEQLLKQALPTASVSSERVSSPTVREGLPSEASPRVVASVFEDRDADSLKHLALALIAHQNVVALLGSRDGDTARLVFARSADAPGDMNTLIRGACSIIGGRGGGRPDMAQGGGTSVEKLGEAIDSASKAFKQ
jgi:alanyl-tRNA synthetase